MGSLSDTSLLDRELDVVYRLEKFKQNGGRLYFLYQLDSNLLLLSLENPCSDYFQIFAVCILALGD